MNEGMLLDWYRAERPVPLQEWIELQEETRQTLADAATRVFLERIGALAAMFADPAELWSLVDGGVAKKRSALIQAMEAETRRRNSNG